MPLVLATESRRGIVWPISRHSLGSLSRGSEGTGREAAEAASSPNRACRPEGAWRTMLSATVISETGAFQRKAASAISISRAAAPALRSWNQELATAVEPPVPWIGPIRLLL